MTIRNTQSPCATKTPDMANPIVVEVTRGGVVESLHRGAYVIANANGDVAASAGDIERPVFPRSAIKIFQALPLVESGAADELGFTPAELALACASHGGEPRHVAAAASMLHKAGFNCGDLECGAHWPMYEQAARDLGASGANPDALHNNCSGKHAGMLALAKHLGVDQHGYVDRDHRVQCEVAKLLGDVCACDLEAASCGIDGCSVPTWAIPLHNLAMGFARLATPASLAGARANAATRLFKACSAAPYMVAGTGRFCTGLMNAVPAAFVKTGAEGVYCGAVPRAGLGIALKCDDGGTRAAEVSMAAILSRLPVFSDNERQALEGFAYQRVENRRGLHVGDVRPDAECFEGVAAASV